MTTMVFVLDRHHKPLMPCHPARARRLLGKGRARIHKLYPFTIRLVDRELKDSTVQPVVLKLDPGSKETGMALVREDETKTHHALYFVNLKHRGSEIKQSLLQRSSFRRSRRSRNLHYRAPRFLNRTRPQGWLAPSLQHRVDTTLSWVERLRRLAPVATLEMELVKFDTQKMQNPEIDGVAYQQGELAGFEVREYLLEKFGRKCIYCGAEGVPLNIDHIVPKSAGGSNRVSNLVLACVDCNQKKNNLPFEVFLKGDKAKINRIRSQLKTPLKDAASVNTTRWQLFEALKLTGQPLTTATGARTKYNRHQFGVPKEHWLDALCVGKVAAIRGWQTLDVLVVKCTGRGAYKRTRLTKDGFPRGYLTRTKRFFGFGTGDMVVATVFAGKKKGSYKGRVAVRKSGSFAIQTASRKVDGISYRYCRLLSRADGYGYSWHLSKSLINSTKEMALLPRINTQVSAP